MHSVSTCDRQLAFHFSPRILFQESGYSAEPGVDLHLQFIFDWQLVSLSLLITLGSARVNRTIHHPSQKGF